MVLGISEILMVISLLLVVVFFVFYIKMLPVIAIPALFLAIILSGVSVKISKQEIEYEYASELFEKIMKGKIREVICYTSMSSRGEGTIVKIRDPEKQLKQKDKEFLVLVNGKVYNLTKCEVWEEGIERENFVN